MRLTRCEMGHFYDMEKFEACPHCELEGKNSDSNMGITGQYYPEYMDSPGRIVPDIPVSTETYNGNSGTQTMDEAMSAFSIAPVQLQKDIQTVEKTPEVQQVPEDEEIPHVEEKEPVVLEKPVSQPVQKEPAAPEQPVSQPAQKPPVTPVQLINQYQPIPTMGDDGHTIGVYDEAFFGVDQIVKQEQKQKNEEPDIRKCHIPCVGWMIAISGPYIGIDFRLGVGKNYIGRSKEMDIALVKDQSVSRKSQAVVIYEPKSHSYLAQSGESSGLVYRNGDLVLSPVRLEMYDVLSVGDTNLMFVPLCNTKFNWNDILSELRKKEN